MQFYCNIQGALKERNPRFEYKFKRIKTEPTLQQWLTEQVARNLVSAARIFSLDHLVEFGIGREFLLKRLIDSYLNLIAL